MLFKITQDTKEERSVAHEHPTTGTPQIPIVFMGTPHFASTILASLLEGGYRVVGVVTRPDRPVGRDQRLAPSPVKVLAEEHSLPLLQPERLDEAALSEIATWKPDLIVVAAYGRILPEKLLELPGMGCVNVHASLLPRWRGASPIQNALMAGDTTTGITLMLMDKGLDTGDIIAERSIPIEPDETAGVLGERLAHEAALFLIEILPQWIKRKITPQPQDGNQAVLCQLIEREDGKIYWDTPAEEIYNRYRGLSPWPGIFTFWKQADDLTRVKLTKIGYQKASPLNELPIGRVFEVGEKIGVRTAQGVIFIEEIQIEGKQPLPIKDFLNGNPAFLGAELV